MKKLCEEMGPAAESRHIRSEVLIVVTMGVWAGGLALARSACWPTASPAGQAGDGSAKATIVAGGGFSEASRSTDSCVVCRADAASPEETQLLPSEQA